MRWIVDLVTAIFRRRRQRRVELFRYWSGTRWRYGDPFRLYRGLWNDPELNLEIQAPLIDAGQEPESSVAIEAMARVFGIERWDPQTERGATDWEILDVFSQLNDYMLGLKKNTNGQPISLPPTDSESSTDSPVVQGAGMTS